MKILTILFILMSIASFALFAVDKSRAVRHRWRIPERYLFLSAVLCGSPGALLAMLLLRHKTRHLSFCLGIPGILIAQLVLISLFK